MSLLREMHPRGNDVNVFIPARIHLVGIFYENVHADVVA